MEVIGAGFGRTGTLSLKAALEQLGFGPCYHMEELLDNPDHAKLWNAAARGRLGGWEKVLGGYRATVDWPGAAFWRKLTGAYPDAKVLLTVRDPERWYESVRNTIFRVPMGGWRVRLPMLVKAVLQPRTLRFFLLMRNVLHGGSFRGVDMRDKQQVIDVFNRHIEDVERSVPADRLLVYDLKQGWEPLCDFLGVDVPDTEFPHLNDAATFHTTFGRRMGRISLTDAAPTLGVLAGAAMLGGLALRRSRASR